MKVLFVAEPLSNHVLDNLFNSISDKISIVASIQAFWDRTGSFDIIHLHWPESLFDWHIPKSNDIELLIDTLSFWRSKSKITITIHNQLSHRRYKLDRQLYREVYQFCDGMIHFGSFSYNLFKEKYPCMHSIIPHIQYADHYPHVNKFIARKKLGISNREKLFVIPGQIRNLSEQRIIEHGLKSIKGPLKAIFLRKYLNRRKSIRTFPFHIFKWLFGKATMSIRELLNRRYSIDYLCNYMTDKELNYYLKAADIIIVPRINALNSGVLILGLSFGKIVVGPKTGNLTEILKKTGNPFWCPKSPESFLRALRMAINSVGSDLGHKNRKYADQYLSSQNVGSSHIRHYHDVLNFI